MTPSRPRRILAMAVGGTAELDEKELDMRPNLSTQLHTWQDESDKVRPAWRRLHDGTPVLVLGEFYWYGTDEEMIALRDVLLEEYALDPEEAQPEPEPEHVHRPAPYAPIMCDAIGGRYAQCSCGLRIHAATRSLYADWEPAKNFLGVEV